MCTFSIDITERDPGLDSMIGVWKDHLFGQIKKLANLDSGRINNQMTGTTRTAYTLLVQSMVTLGMMCLAIIASILLVLQVLQVIPVYFFSVNNQTIIFFVSKITPINIQKRNNIVDYKILRHCNSTTIYNLLACITVFLSIIKRT